MHWPKGSTATRYSIAVRFAIIASSHSVTAKRHQRPFRSVTFGEWFEWRGLTNRKTLEPKISGHRFAPDLPIDVHDLTLKCLAKSQADRFQTAPELLKALQSCDCTHNLDRTPSPHMLAGRYGKPYGDSLKLFRTDGRIWDA